MTSYPDDSINAPPPAPWKRVIGIIGGLGPHAHLELERLLLAETERRLGRPATDRDYPPWIVSSIPATPDRTRAIDEATDAPMAELERSLRRLTGADFAVIPCNTAHHFLDKLRARTELPILDTIEETAIEAARLAGVGARIGLLATTGAIRTDLYQRAMARVDPTATILTPLDLDAERGAELQDACVMTPIYGPRDASGARLGGIKAGGLDDPARRERLAAPLRRAIELLREAGASVVILGCTEIPLVIERGSREGLTLLDPMQVAARACLDIASGARPLPAARSTCARFPDCV